MACDKELVEAISRKDAVAYNEFYDRYSFFLYRWALNRIRDKDITDDVSQNFWILLWEEPDMIKLDESGSAKRFLLHLFNLRMIDYLRAASTRLLTSDNTTSTEIIAEVLTYSHIDEEFEKAEFYNIINSIIQELPAMTQKIFTLLYKEELSIKETAKKLNINEKTVSYKSRDCIEFIRRRLERMQMQEAKYSHRIEPTLKVIIILYVALQEKGI